MYLMEARLARPRPRPETGGFLPRIRAFFLFLAAAAIVPAQPDDRYSSLKALSIEELLETEISTLSGAEQSWWTAPGAIDILRFEDIRRSPARSLPDILRLATGVHVAQSSERSWAVGIRGFNVLSGNKVSVMMDGRRLHSPLFSGVQWDAQHTLLADIEQIDVVRGPVGSFRGAFAVNGLIQIRTKPAWDTQGWYLNTGTGTEDPFFLAARYGGHISESSAYRVYASYQQMDWTYNASGDQTFNTVDFLQSGFRIDSRLPADTTFTFQGDLYTNKGTPKDRLQAGISGGNLLTRLRREMSDQSRFEILAYYDRSERDLPQSFHEIRDSVFASIQYNWQFDRQTFIFGADYFMSRDEVDGFGFSIINPRSRTISSHSAFLQYSLEILPDELTLSAGLKGEYQTLAGSDWHPSLRATWTPGPDTAIWVGLSRAGRPPVRLDEDFSLVANETVFVEANDAFRTERVTAFELGLRRYLNTNLYIDVATFHNRYNELRSSEQVGDGPFPLMFQNKLNAESWGTELSIDYRPTDKLRLKLGYRYLDLDYWTDSGSTDTSNGADEGNDPRHIATLAVRLNLPWHLELDTFVRYVSSLPSPATPAYTALDFRLGWQATPFWSLALMGRNLLDDRHPELITTNSLNEEVAHQISIEATYRY